MKQVEIIRLGIIAVALFLGYEFIVYSIEFICNLAQVLANSDVYKLEGRGILYLILKMAGFFAASYLLIRNSRRISEFIESQK
jgi:hypothetical protein